MNPHVDEKSIWVTEMVQRYEQRLIRYTARLTGRSVAHEIVQETFLRLWKEDRRKLEGRVVEWLYTVCRNQAIDCRRREAHRTRAAADIPIEAVRTPEEQTDQRQSMLALLCHLTEDEQEVLRLKFQEDLSYKEISA